jgi:hypothetical protein
MAAREVRFEMRLSAEENDEFLRAAKEDGYTSSRSGGDRATWLRHLGKLRVRAQEEERNAKKRKSG